MKAILGTAALLTLAASTVVAAPLVPRITSHDFNFGAWETGEVPFYDPRGDAPDYLTLLPDRQDREVTAFWQVWPVGGIPLPVFNAIEQFGGDIALALQFNGHDETANPLDVSVTGSGRNEGADLIISGAIPGVAGGYQPLLAIDIRNASMYGYGGASSFVLETAGVITFMSPNLPGYDPSFIGTPAVSRGNVDFQELALPSRYNPLGGNTDVFADGGGYSGEVGPGFAVPEPATLATLLLGLGMMARRRA